MCVDGLKRLNCRFPLSTHVYRTSQRTRTLGNWSKQVCSKRTHPVWGRGVIKDTTYLMNITDKILMALKFELTQKYSASKSQHC